MPASLFSEALFFSIRLKLLDSARDMPYQSLELTLFARMVLLTDERRVRDESPLLVRWL